MARHILKTWPVHFQAVKSGRKRFELRRNDRAFAAGDELQLREFNPSSETYSGDVLTVDVTHILQGGAFGLDADSVAMSINLRAPDVRENWSVTDYGVATPDEVETALGLIGMDNAALSYRVGACFMRAGAFAAPVDTDGDIAECARRLGWMVSELIDGFPWERRGPAVAALQALGAALWAHDEGASEVLANGVHDDVFQALHEEALRPSPTPKTEGGAET